MPILKVRHFFCSTIFATFIPTLLLAQEGSVHGANITPLSGDGCFYTANNAPVTNPFRDPGVANAILCRKNYNNVVTYQGEGGKASNIGQTVTSSVTVTDSTDILGNIYKSFSVDSKQEYCQGSSCYAAAPNDGAYRFGTLSINLQNTVKATNAKTAPNPNFAPRLATSLVVDGRAIAAEFENNAQILEVKKDEIRLFEIFPVAPNFNTEAELSNKDLNPYKIDFEAPDLNLSPHRENAPGVGFRTAFDTEVGKWRYYLYVDGTQIKDIGKYIIQYRFTRTIPYTVSFRYLTDNDTRRFCNNKPECSRDFNLYSIATLTLAYGTEQCLQKSGLNIPSMEPLLSVYRKAINDYKKAYKKPFQKFKKSPGTIGYIFTRRIRRQLEQANKNLNAIATAEAVSRNNLSQIYSQAELSALYTDLISKATGIIISPKGANKGLNIPLKKIGRSAIRVTGYKSGTPTKEEQKLKAKTIKIVKANNIQGDKAYNQYSDDWNKTIAADLEVRNNSYLCVAAF